METIEHKTVATNGINMHVASIGTGPVILFLHGFPELWYSWRHQLLFLSSRGYHCTAPDLRGYGDTDAPTSANEYSVLHVVGDLTGMLQALGFEEKVFLVGHDWGASIAWYFCMFRPDRVKGLVNTSVAFMPRNQRVNLVEGIRTLYADDHCICRFQEPGEAEADFAQVDTVKLIRSLYTLRNPNRPVLPKQVGCRSLPDPTNLPSWLSEEDVNYYARKFKQTGFT